MSEKYKIRNPEGKYFVTFTIENWMHVFSLPVFKYIFTDSLNYCHSNKDLNIHAYVLMCNHAHAILSTNGESTLQDVIRDFKKYTSKEIIKTINNQPDSRKEILLNVFADAAKRNKRGINYGVWQDGFHPIELDNNKLIDQRLEYIHFNPVKAEIVFQAEDYKFSSAIDYAGGIGLVKIDKIE